jgi:hypothetical protein
MARASNRSQSAPPSAGAVVPAGTLIYQSDAKLATRRHLASVMEDIGSLEDPKAGAKIVKIAAEILQPLNKRFRGIHNISRKKYIEDRCDTLLLNPQMAEIISLLETDAQGGVDKDSAEWGRRAVYDTLVELRSVLISLDIASTNEAFEEWDSLAAKTTASEKSIDEKTLKVIGEGAGLSTATRMMIAHEAITAHVNDKAKSPPIKAKGKEERPAVVPPVPTPARADRTPGAKCSFCGKDNHTDDQCWKRKGHQQPSGKERRRSRSPRRYRRSPSRRRDSRSPERDRKERRRDDRQDGNDRKGNDRGGVKKEKDF